MLKTMNVISLKASECWQSWIGRPVLLNDSLQGILQYYGKTKFADGNWCGIELTLDFDGSVSYIFARELKVKQLHKNKFLLHIETLLKNDSLNCSQEADVFSYAEQNVEFSTLNANNDILNKNDLTLTEDTMLNNIPFFLSDSFDLDTTFTSQDIKTKTRTDNLNECEFKKMSGIETKIQNIFNLDEGNTLYPSNNVNAETPCQLNKVKSNFVNEKFQSDNLFYDAIAKKSSHKSNSEEIVMTDPKQFFDTNGDLHLVSNSSTPKSKTIADLFSMEECLQNQYKDHISDPEFTPILTSKISIKQSFSSQINGEECLLEQSLQQVPDPGLSPISYLHSTYESCKTKLVNCTFSTIESSSNKDCNICASSENNLRMLKPSYFISANARSSTFNVQDTIDSIVINSKLLNTTICIEDASNEIKTVINQTFAKSPEEENGRITKEWNNQKSEIIANINETFEKSPEDENKSITNDRNDHESEVVTNINKTFEKSPEYKNECIAKERCDRKSEIMTNINKTFEKSSEDENKSITKDRNDQESEVATNINKTFEKSLEDENERITKEWNDQKSESTTDINQTFAKSLEVKNANLTKEKCDELRANDEVHLSAQLSCLKIIENPYCLDNLRKGLPVKQDNAESYSNSATGTKIFSKSKSMELQQKTAATINFSLKNVKKNNYTTDSSLMTGTGKIGVSIRNSSKLRYLSSRTDILKENLQDKTKIEEVSLMTGTGKIGVSMRNSSKLHYLSSRTDILKENLQDKTKIEVSGRGKVIRKKSSIPMFKRP